MNEELGFHLPLSSLSLFSLPNASTLSQSSLEECHSPTPTGETHPPESPSPTGISSGQLRSQSPLIASSPIQRLARQADPTALSETLPVGVHPKPWLLPCGRSIALSAIDQAFPTTTRSCSRSSIPDDWSDSSSFLPL